MLKKQLKWYGKEVTAAVEAAAARGLQLAAEHVLEEANRIVPEQEGTLLRSGVAVSDPSALTAAVSYDTPYAVRQHEELNYRHDAGRSAKYLEMPLEEARGAKVLERLVAQEVKKVT